MPRLRPAFRALWALACLSGGCVGEAISRPDAGTQGDAGPEADAGGPPDAGPTIDAGLTADAGRSTDAGRGVDAGSPSDGGTQNTGCGSDAGAASYSTSFPLTETPLSEGGRWVDGKTVGLDWNDPLSAAGESYASVLSGATGNRYDDSIAHLNASFCAFAADQFAQGTAFRVAGYDPSPSKHEVELHLRFQTTAHSARGYEVMWGITGYLAIVRWNGAAADYTAIYDSGDPGIGPPANGDVLRAQISGTIITVYKNGVLVNTTDVSSIGGTVWTTGQPGLGFWPVDSAIKENYGWSAYQAGNL